MVVFTIVSSNYYTFDKNSHRLVPLLLSCVSTERVCSRSYDSKTLVPTLLTDKRHFLVLHLCLKRQPKECAVVLTIANSDSHAFLTGEPRNVTIWRPRLLHKRQPKECAVVLTIAYSNCCTL